MISWSEVGNSLRLYLAAGNATLLSAVLGVALRPGRILSWLLVWALPNTGASGTQCKAPIRKTYIVGWPRSENGNPGLGVSMRNLGMLWILYGLLRLVGALGAFLYSGTLTLMWGALLNRVPNPFALMDLFHVFLIFVIILGIVAGVVSIIAGLTLMSSGQSARTLGLLAAFFGLTNGPLGIALGAYTLVVLVPANARNS
jgi:hypothetical protein